MSDMAGTLPGAGEPAAGEPIVLRYEGRWQEVARIALINALLSFVTFGIYSFWGRTRIRRYLWSHTSANGDPLEYHGTGGQILVGFIVVSVIFAGINLVQSGLEILLIGDVAAPEMLKRNIPAYVLLLLAAGAAYLTFFAYVTYSVRRYWLAMTSWRGIRLRQGGRRRVLVRRALPWALLSVVTLGLAYPWLILRSEGYAYGESHVGDRQFRFSAPAWPLFRAWLLLWAVSLFLLIVPLGALLYFMDAYSPDLDPETVAGTEAMGDRLFWRLRVLPWLLLAWGGVYAAAVYLAWANWRARLFNIAVTGLSIDGMRFAGRIGAKVFASAYLRVIALTAAILVATAAAFSLWAGWTIFVLAAIGVIADIREELMVVAASIGILALFVPFLVVFVSFGLARNIIVVHGLWKARVEATSVSGRIDTQSIRQTDLERPRFGEGLGQVFDASFGEA